MIFLWRKHYYSPRAVELQLCFSRKCTEFAAIMLSHRNYVSPFIKVYHKSYIILQFPLTLELSHSVYYITVILFNMSHVLKPELIIFHFHITWNCYLQVSNFHDPISNVTRMSSAESQKGATAKYFVQW